MKEVGTAHGYHVLQRFVVGILDVATQSADPHVPFENTLHVHACVVSGFGCVQ